jgi:nucleoside-diphosphate kinase
MIESTLVLVKPDGVARGIATSVLSRFERVGLKLSAIKMVHPTAEQAKSHYLQEDIATRHSEAIWLQLIDYLTEAPVLVAAFSGVGAIEIARKIAGPTEPRTAPPGTIRGDYCHQSYAVCNAAGKAVRNVIHASADEADAERELSVWFSRGEILSYRRTDDYEHYLGTDHD